MLKLHSKEPALRVEERGGLMCSQRVLSLWLPRVVLQHGRTMLALLTLLSHQPHWPEPPTLASSLFRTIQEPADHISLLTGISPLPCPCSSPSLLILQIGPALISLFP